MNKELIKIYFEEFKHWLNGGNIQAFYIKDDEPKWITDEECREYEGHDNFNHIIQNSLEPDDVLIVIDDDYVELRKALAEGKIIQLDEAAKFSDPNRGWVDLSCKSFGSSTQLFPVNYYRIKPEEPKFKVGDWAVNKTSKQRIVKKITSICGDSVTVGNTEVGINVMLINDLELWEPKPGEWCWVYDKTTRIPVLRKFVCMNTKGETDYTTAFPYEVENIDPSSILHFRYIEPFIGQLPTILKELNKNE